MLLFGNEYFAGGKSTGNYHFVLTDGENTRLVGYCASGYCVHKSAIEASDCYRRWCIEKNNGFCLSGVEIDKNFGTNLELKYAR